jgi:RNA polymerase primary sigma factor
MTQNAVVVRKKKKRGPALLAPNAAETRLVAFYDLEIPVKPLLTLEEETRSGARIRSCLKRLASLLPRHPEGYRRFLSRMHGVLTGGTVMFSWFPMRHQIAADLEVATRSLAHAESLLESSPARAMSAYQEGVAILRMYPLDPETLYQWAREVAGSLRASRSLSEVEEFQKVDRVVQLLTRTLEKERDRLVMPNFRLVLKEVFRYRPIGMKRSDLFQEGIIGLHKAVFRFDSKRGIRFSTYATYWIRQAMRKCLTDKARLIRVPQAIQEELRKKDSSLKPDEVERLRHIMKDTYMLSYGESDDSSDRYAFEIKDPCMPEMVESLRIHRLPDAVQDALRTLSSRHRDVLQRRFGLSGERPQTLEEIGIHLNLSRERIRQIEQEAINVMRKSKGLCEVYEDLGHASVTVAETHN